MGYFSWGDWLCKRGKLSVYASLFFLVLHMIDTSRMFCHCQPTPDADPMVSPDHEQTTSKQFSSQLITLLGDFHFTMDSDVSLSGLSNKKVGDRFSFLIILGLFLCGGISLVSTQIHNLKKFKLKKKTLDFSELWLC